MKKSKSIYGKLLAFLLVCLSVSSLFEASAINYLKEVAQNNVEFLAVVAEIKMVISGISSINIPFISGHTAGVSHSLDKVENYLLLTDSISFIQIMLISITKTWVFKICLILLFIVSLIETKSKHISRVLVFVLALSPGLSIYTTVMHKMYESAAIDYGTAYLQEMDSTVQKVKQENMKLMRDHNKQISKIDSSKKGFKLFDKLKADVAYDIKKVGNSVSGDYKEIRTLIKTSGHEVTAKISRFCSMVLFSLLLMPIGYAFLIYILFNSLFRKLSVTNIIDKTERDINQLKTQPNKKSFFKKFSNIIGAIRKELTNAEEETKHQIKAKEKVSGDQSTTETKKSTKESPTQNSTSQTTEEEKDPTSNQEAEEKTEQPKKKPIKRSPGSMLSL